MNKIDLKNSFLLFLISWIFYGFMTNGQDLKYYSLYHVGADAIVEHGTFTLGQTLVPEFKNAGDGDIFGYKDKIFIAKQPGSFVLAAVPYFFLRIFGLNYEKNFDILSGLVSWFTAALLAAVSVAFFYHLLLLFNFSRDIAGIGTLSYGLATTLLPYTGIPHHDVLATALLVISFFLIERIKRAQKGDSLWAGVTLSLVLFFSMLPSLIVGALGVYALAVFNQKQRLKFIAGLALGYLPLGAYNTYYFDYPWVQANMAGRFEDTFFKFSWASVLDKFFIYFSINSQISATKYEPVIFLGILGVFLLKKDFRKEKLLIAGLSMLHLVYLFNIQTVGHCQYGPRYLIPLIPFWMIGLGIWFQLSKISAVIASAFILYSFAINAVGAFGNTLYCDLLDFGFTLYWKKLPALTLDSFPLWPLCFFLCLVVLGLIFQKKKNFII